MDLEPLFTQTLITTALSGSISTLVVKTWLERRFERHRFTRDWKEKSLSTIIGPVVMHLDRTKRGAARYQEKYASKTDSFFEARLMRDSNETIRSLLLSNGHLLPDALRVHAHALVAHYDVWLRRFDAKVALEKPDANSTFDVGFAEVPFPDTAEQAFSSCFKTLRDELYGIS